MLFVYAGAAKAPRAEINVQILGDVRAAQGEIADMAKKTAKRKHTVKAQISNVELTRAKSALTLEVYANEEKIGELRIGRGSLYWWGAKRKLAKRVEWSRFGKMMDKLAFGDAS